LQNVAKSCEIQCRSVFHPILDDNQISFNRRLKGDGDRDEERIEHLSASKYSSNNDRNNFEEQKIDIALVGRKEIIIIISSISIILCLCFLVQSLVLSLLFPYHWIIQAATWPNFIFKLHTSTTWKFQELTSVL
jgi:uncharacterized membrane protein